MKPKCLRCRRKTLDEYERLYQRADGRYLCSPCIVALTNDAEVIEANRQLDDWIERQSRKPQ